MNEFERQLDADSHDWATRLVYADWLEEQGEDVRANGQRWQAENEKEPKHIGPSQFTWWLGSVHRTHDLSVQVFEPAGEVRLGRDFPTRQAAEVALAERLHEMELATDASTS